MYVTVVLKVMLDVESGVALDTDGTTHAKKERNRGSYMSAYVLLNLLNELGKRDQMRGMLIILSLFCNEFNSIIQEHRC